MDTVLATKRKIALSRLEKTVEVGKLALLNDDSRIPFLSRVARIDRAYADFEDCHLKLASKSDNFEAEDSIRELADDCYYEILAIQQRLLPKLPADDFEDSDTSKKCNLKLPKITLPSFDGDFKSWSSFIDLYNNMIHDKRDISNIEKFHYLLASLKGEPRQLLQNFTVSEINYFDAYNALLSRYNSKRKLAFLYWEEIRSLTLKGNSEKEFRRLLNTFNENLCLLKNLDLPTREWDYLLFHTMLVKLDVKTRERFETQLSSNVIPTYGMLEQFLANHCQALEMSHMTLAQPSTSKRATLLVGSGAPSMDRSKCTVCTGVHSINRCDQFLSKRPRERYDVARQLGLCINCLRPRHNVSKCQSSGTCKLCQSKHNTLLHFEKSATNANDNPSASSTSLAIHCKLASTKKVNTLSNLTNTSPMLLSTVTFEIKDFNGRFQKARAILDTASHVNFITRSCKQRLGLISTKSPVTVETLGQSSSVISDAVRCVVTPHGKPTETFDFDAFVVPTICGNMPESVIDPKPWGHVRNLQLADPTYHLPGKVDLLLSADVLANILQPGLLVGKIDEPVAMNTIFGWTLLGKTDSSSSRIRTSTNLHVGLSHFLENSIRQFWEIETLPKINTPLLLSKEEQASEKIFVDSHTRTDSGRFVVALPFSGPEPTFIDTRTIALRRFLSLERRLRLDPVLYEGYRAFMKDYCDSGHMSLASSCRDSDGSSYYIAHHAVQRPESTTTALRVVFDCSMKDARAQSLNDCILVGPKLQRDILPILLRFRLHAIVFTADIRQMYRQISITPFHRRFQKILWRKSVELPILEYVLNTVTYGMASSPFLAIRCLLELANLHGAEYPFAAQALERDTYMDDIITGCEDLSEALDAKNQLVNILQKGKFELRKWASNDPHLLDSIDPNLIHKNVVSFEENDNTPIKILGLEWLPNQDQFKFHANVLNRNCTKRVILSELARTYDPLGFLTPLSFLIKYLIQTLWTLGIDWDQDVPDHIQSIWTEYKTSLSALSKIEIPRRVLVKNMVSCQLHGFCDSSEKGYAAVIYFRLCDTQGEISTRLVCARSRVAPLKKISLPRLELCAAVLLSELIEFVNHSSGELINFENIFAWSDSMITLHWLKSPSSRWKTFVANRVSMIQERVDPACWHHVDSKSNPADPASRGLMPVDLVANSLWWAGAPWLMLPKSEWPCKNLEGQDLNLAVAEERAKVHTTLLIDHAKLDWYLDKYSSLKTIKRIVAYVFRYLYNLKNRSARQRGNLTNSEIHNALLFLIGIVQKESFSSELELLKHKKLLPKHFRKLNPFIDESGLIRVGGRLEASELPYESRHPALLPRNHRLVDLIIQETHNIYCHPGAQTLLYLLRQHFWILSAKRAINRVISKCIPCFRLRPKFNQPLMGNLPAARIQQQKPFSVVSVDMGGPITTSLYKGRGTRTQKSYICVFVCFATKALHIELVSDLSTDAFIAALHRFIARRGRCIEIYCDNGTNFVGASNRLRGIMEDAVESQNIKFHFNPPKGPHFGGLHEAAVKSVKNHIVRTIGRQILTFEELYTLLTQIEAMCNSRPLSPLSSDPNDLSVLSPGMFLTLAPLTTLPEQDYSDVNITRLSRWQLLQQLHQALWKRWHREYLNNLQQRHKWNKSGSPPREGMLVLVNDENLAPLYWRIGRILKLHYGTDNICRVATIKTSQGTFQRPIVRLCPLPIQEVDEQ